MVNKKQERGGKVIKEQSKSKRKGVEKWKKNKEKERRHKQKEKGGKRSRKR